MRHLSDDPARSVRLRSIVFLLKLSDMGSVSI
jgi:hypothetical protein